MVADRKRVPTSRIALTSRGVGVLCAAVVLGAAGVAGGYPELATLAATALVALAIAALAVLPIPHLAVTRDLAPDRVSRGDACKVVLAVTAVPVAVSSTSKAPPRYGTVTALATDRCGPVDVPVPIPRLRPGRATSLEYPVPTTRRGVVAIGPLSITRADPFGLARRVTVYGGVDRALVYPRAHPLRAMPVGRARSLDGQGERVPQGTITFDRLRPYVAGDELRNVHWRTSARLGELMVREHVEASRPRMLVVLDNRTSAYGAAAPIGSPAPIGSAAPVGSVAVGTAAVGSAAVGSVAATPDAFEEVCDAAASLVVAAAEQDIPVRVSLLAGAFAGTGAAESVFDMLAEAELVGETASGSAGGEADPDEAARVAAMISHLRRGAGADTVVFLTGTGSGATVALAAIAGTAIAGRAAASASANAPTIMVAQFGRQDGTPALDGVRHLQIDDAIAFAAAWDSVDAW